MSKAFIGTSGFSYPHWGDGIFYPKDLPQTKWFEYYCQYFKSVELNVSFYRLPKKEVFASWRKRAGKDFVFSIKGSRFITHIKKLKDCGEAVERFFEAVEGLKLEVGSWKLDNEMRSEISKNQDISLQNPASHFSRLTSKDVVLWQLPPGLKADSIRLESFLKILPKTWRHAFEFRHPSWLAEEIYQVLRKYNAAVVFQDYPDWPMTRKISADFIYIRFHGNRDLYSSEYTKEELKAWASDIRKWLKQGKDVYVYFNNDALGYAVPNAQRLKKLVE